MGYWVTGFSSCSVITPILFSFPILAAAKASSDATDKIDRAIMEVDQAIPLSEMEGVGRIVYRVENLKHGIYTLYSPESLPEQYVIRLCLIHCHVVC